MNILTLCPKLPYPASDGGRIAIFEPLRRLAARGHDLTLLTFAHGPPQEEALAYLRQFCRLELVAHDTRSHLLPAAMNLLSPEPYTIAKYASAAMARRLRSLMAEEQFALVQLENLHMSGYQAITKGEFHCPTLLRQQNVESLLAERYAATQRGLRRRYALLHAMKVRRFESRMGAAMDLCLMITPQDAERMRRLNPRARTVVIPAGIDGEGFDLSPTREEPGSIVSIAAMDWPPNVDAVRWFHDHVLPLVRQARPDVRFYVVGKHPPPAIQALAQPDRVVVTGFVDDVRDYLARGSVFVVPLRAGGGMRLKLLQAMAAARAIVSTTIGAEGISVTHEGELLLADDAAGFAAQTIRLLNDGALRRKLGRQARSVALGSYSWDYAVDLLESAYRQALA